MAARDEFVAIAKLQARKAGRAVVIAKSLHVTLRKDAFLFAPLKMAGEERLWAAAFGARGDEPTIACAGDARNVDDEVASVVHPVAMALDEYFQGCNEDGTVPQVWVASPAAVSLLDALGDRRGSKDPLLATLGRHAWFLVERYRHEGQQVLMPATEILTEHFATGQSGTEDQHLGTVLAWVDRPDGDTAEAIARREEETPAGVATDVEVDHKLERPLERIGELRKDKIEESDGRIKTAKAEIADALRPQALRVLGLIDRTIRTLERQKLRPLPGLSALELEDQSAFEFYMRRGFIPTRFSPKENAQHLSSRESAIDAADSALLRGDANVQVVAVQDGEVLVGTVGALRNGSRRDSYSGFELHTSQAVSRLRIGDVVSVDAVQNIDCQLTGIGTPAADGRRTYTFEVTAGKTFIGRFRNREIRLLPTTYSGYNRTLKQLADAHNAKPWILVAGESAPPSANRRVPADPLGALERLK